MIKLVGQFIGQEKIISINVIKRTTYLGKQVVEVELGSKTKREYPLKSLELITTKEAQDLVSLRELEIKSVAEQVLILLAESELTIENIKYLMQTKIPLSIEHNIDLANEKLYGKDKYNITFMDYEKVLRGK